MIIYIDSSFLLSIILEEDNRDISKEIWKKFDYRVSSILLKSQLAHAVGFIPCQRGWPQQPTIVIFF